MNDPRELEFLRNYKPSINDLKMKSPDELYPKSKMIEGREITNTEQAIKEFAEKWSQTWNDNKGWTKDTANRDLMLSDLTTLISEHYYPKEFVEWMIMGHMGIPTEEEIDNKFNSSPDNAIHPDRYKAMGAKWLRDIILKNER